MPNYILMTNSPEQTTETYESLQEKNTKLEQENAALRQQVSLLLKECRLARHKQFKNTRQECSRSSFPSVRTPSIAESKALYLVENRGLEPHPLRCQRSALPPWSVSLPKITSCF